MTFYFKRGRINVAGAPTYAKTFTWKIVGDTGSYRRTKGRATIHDLTHTTSGLASTI